MLDTNAGQVGIGGFVGVDSLVLDRIDRPELELDGAGSLPDDDLDDGLVVGAGNVTIHRPLAAALVFATAPAKDTVTASPGSAHPQM